MEPIKPGWKTTEFWASLGGSVAAIVAVFVALGKLTPEAGQSLSTTISAAVVAIGAAIAAVLPLLSYNQSRTIVKEAHEAAKAQVESSKE